MSDDTPTQRFPEQGDNPTERISTTEVQEDLQEEKQKSKGLLIGLIVAGALLLVAIIVLVFVLGRAMGNPGDPSEPQPEPTTSQSATPEPDESATPTPTPTPTEDAPPPPPPPSNDPTITSWQVTPGTVYCNTQAPNPSNQYLALKWTTSGADRIDIGIVDEGSYQLMYYNVSPSGTQQNIGQDIIYLCPRAEMVWRITIYKNGNEIAHKDVKIRNNGDQQ